MPSLISRSTCGTCSLLSMKYEHLPRPKHPDLQPIQPLRHHSIYNIKPNPGAAVTSSQQTILFGISSKVQKYWSIANHCHISSSSFIITRWCHGEVVGAMEAAKPTCNVSKQESQPRQREFGGRLTNSVLKKVGNLLLPFPHVLDVRPGLMGGSRRRRRRRWRLSIRL